MSVDLIALGRRFLFTKPNKVILSSLMVVDGYLYLISSGTIADGITFLEFTYNAFILASIAYNMTFL